MCGPESGLGDKRSRCADVCAGPHRAGGGLGAGVPLGPGPRPEPRPHPDSRVRAALCAPQAVRAQGPPRSAQEPPVHASVHGPACPRSRPPPGPSSQPFHPVFHPTSRRPHPRSCPAPGLAFCPPAPPSLSFPLLPVGVGAHSAFLRGAGGSTVACPQAGAAPGPAPSSAAGRCSQQQGALWLFGGARGSLLAPRPPPAWPCRPATAEWASVRQPWAGPRPTLGGGSGSRLAHTLRGLKSWKMREFPTFFSRFRAAGCQGAGPPPPQPHTQALFSGVLCCDRCPCLSSSAPAPPPPIDPTSLPPKSFALRPTRSTEQGRQGGRDKQDTRRGACRPDLLGGGRGWAMGAVPQETLGTGAGS